MNQRRRGLTWGVKLPLLFVLFAAAPIAGLAFWTFDVLEDTFTTSTISSLQALVRAKVESIDQFSDDRRSDVERLGQLVAPSVEGVLDAEALVRAAEETPPTPPAELPQLADAEQLGPQGLPPEERAEVAPLERTPAPLETPVEPQPSPPEPPLDPTPQEVLAEAQADLRQSLHLVLWGQQKFEELLVIDVQGRVLASTFPGHEGKSAADLAYFQSGLRTTYTQPVFTSPITERLTMVIATPIQNEEAQVVGVLAARLNLDRFFRLIGELTGLGETGETVVGRLVGEEVVFMAPTRHDPDAALQRKVGLDAEASRGLRQAATGQSGAGQALDYRGKCVYSAWEPVAALEWALVVKVDCDEAMAGLERARRDTTVVAIVLTALAFVAAFLVARTLVRPLRELEHAADRISKGDFDVQLDIRSRDEVGDLADSFERMIAAIKFFREHSRSDDEEDELAQASSPALEVPAPEPPEAQG